MGTTDNKMGTTIRCSLRNLQFACTKASIDEQRIDKQAAD